MSREQTLAKLAIKDVMSLVVEKPTTIIGSAPMDELLAKVNEDKKTRHVYVVDEENRLVGVIRMTSIVEYLFPLTSMMLHAREFTLNKAQAMQPQQAKDIMNGSPLYINENSTIPEAAQLLITERINELPVVDDDMKVIGQLNVYEFIAAYLNEESTGT